MEFYKENINNIFKELSVQKEIGLNHSEASNRLQQYGTNELKEEKKESFFFKIINQFKDFLVIILIAASIISMIVGETTDAIVILAIVVVNAILGIVQEGKAEKALEALKKMASPNAKVLRNGKIDIVPANTIVPGDVAFIEAGDIVPADLRLFESSNLKIDESSLTGESVPVEKDSNIYIEGEVSLGDRKNMAYMSTIVTYGRGKGIVVGTGENTEIGKIAEMLQNYGDETTPLQRKLNELGKYLGISCIIICGVVFAIGLFQGRNILDMFMISISLAVAAIPEGLPAIVTIVLALGMKKMVKRNAIVKKLLAVETLGCTTFICSDKTGTLTQNEMTVTKAFTNMNALCITGHGYKPGGQFFIDNNPINSQEKQDINLLLTSCILCNDASLEKTDDETNTWRIVGDPTEGALITFAEKGDLAKKDLNKSYPRIEEIPFDSNRKMMTTFHENFPLGNIVSFTKGAPDIVIKNCKNIYVNGKKVQFTDDLKKKVIDENSKYSKEALRVLAFAYRTYDNIPSNINSKTIEKNMTFIGLVGMIDPPRKEAKDAIDVCKKAGIKSVMITGDYKDTAFAIAKSLGIAKSEDEAMTGDELNKISDEELEKRVKTTRVYARVSPEHKVRIIEALKNNGEVIAMTGDGVNDALALKRADIGVSMGITGTDVAKNTADVILTDDNFASIVSAVEEGRIIYSNIKKFVFFLLSCNIGEILIVLLSILFNLPVPLIPIQLLWLNLITDSFPALALGVEKGEPDIMEIPPRNPNEPILNKRMAIGIGIQSIALTIAVLLSYMWGLNIHGHNNLIVARTIAFATLITAELLRAYSSRSERFTLFEIGFFTNHTLIYSTILSFLLLIAVIYIPILQPIFKTYPISLKEWSIIIRFAIIPIITGELSKLFLKEQSKK